MKETRLKGVIAALIVGVVCLGLSLFLGVLHWQSTDKNQLIKSEAIYKTSSSQDAVVLIDYIYPEAIGTLDNGNSLYLIGYVQPDGYLGYVGLEAKESDKELQALIKTSKEALAENPQYLVVKVKSTLDKESIVNYENYLRETLSSNAELSQSMDYSTYVTRLNLGLGQAIYFIIPIMLVLGGAGFLTAWKLKKSNAAVYEELYHTYPNLQGNIQALHDSADYIDESIGLLVYKNHIFGYKQRLFLFDLREVTNLYHHVINHKKYGLITIHRSSSLVFKTQDSHKAQEVAIKNVGKNTDLQLQPLFDYIQNHFPHIVLGYKQ